MAHSILVFLISIYFANVNANECGSLYLTESAVYTTLELNWDFSCLETPDTIALTFGDLKIDPNAEILQEIFPGSISRGYYLTNFSIIDSELPGNWSIEEDNADVDLETFCFNYYIVSIRNGTVIDSQCFRIHPAWMANFGPLRLGRMMIPGTHNAGAYISPLPELVTNWVFNQNRRIWVQLVHGMRYFDIRIGRYGDPPNGFYINHDIIQCAELLPELQSIATFLRKSPKEVVILDFHLFPVPSNFTLDYHYELLNLLQTTFENQIYPYNTITDHYGPTLQEFWDSGKRVIISYADEQLVLENPWLWPPIERYWGDKQFPQDLEVYIKQQLVDIPLGNPLSVLMTELTPSPEYVITHLNESLKDLADMVNKDLIYWIKANNGNDNANIIASDFFTGNEITNLAIETNFRRLGVAAE